MANASVLLLLMQSSLVYFAVIIFHCCHYHCYYCYSHGVRYPYMFINVTYHLSSPACSRSASSNALLMIINVGAPLQPPPVPPLPASPTAPPPLPGPTPPRHHAAADVIPATTKITPQTCATVPNCRLIPVTHRRCHAHGTPWVPLVTPALHVRTATSSASSRSRSIGTLEARRLPLYSFKWAFTGKLQVVARLGFRTLKNILSQGYEGQAVLLRKLA